MPSLVDLTERLVPISDFSQERPGKFFLMYLKMIMSILY